MRGGGGGGGEIFIFRGKGSRCMYIYRERQIYIDLSKEGQRD